MRPNTLVRFDPQTEKFQTWTIPSGGHVIRNMQATANGNLVLAESGINKVASGPGRRQQPHELTTAVVNAPPRVTRPRRPSPQDVPPMFRRSPSLSLLFLFVALVPDTAVAQRTTGQLRLEVRDAAGRPLEAEGTLLSEATHIRRAFAVDATGTHVVVDVPFGLYHLEITLPGFVRHSTLLDVRSELPVVHQVTLALAPFQTAINVSAAAPATILDPYRGAAVNYLGTEQLRERPASAPGRTLIDLVNTQPGWVLEANGILHARGSEYQIQYVIDGIPLRDNRSPAFAQSLGIEEFESMAVRTAGYPAEFGGKLGAVIEVSTVRDTRPGLHGMASIEAGSFGTRSGYFSGQYAGDGTIAGASVERMTTDRYLDPPNDGNFTNHGQALGVSGRVEHAWNDSNRTRAYVYRRSSRFQVPNEALQQAAGQLQERTAGESLGQVAHQQVLSPRVLLNARVMARESEATLESERAVDPDQARPGPATGRAPRQRQHLAASGAPRDQGRRRNDVRRPG